jgi:hypothetical protein
MYVNYTFILAALNELFPEGTGHIGLTASDLRSILLRAKNKQQMKKKD